MVPKPKRKSKIRSDREDGSPERSSALPDMKSADMNCKPPKNLVLTENALGTTWKKWLQQWQWYSTASCMSSRPEEIQVASFMSAIGPEVIDIYNSFDLGEEFDLAELIGSMGLRLEALDVPHHANVGTSVTLACFYDLGEDKLYSVKWYKDDYEFYRFMPDNTPTTQIFPVNGIHLDTSSSDMNHVKLDSLEYASSGTFKCEVSKEGPAFNTVFSSENMTVLAYPDRPPIITGAEESYSIGDFITVNCSSGRSNPEPVLAWFINNQKADNFLLDHNSPKKRHGNPNYMGDLYSRSLGMRLKAERIHFKGSKMTVSLKCTSTVADMPPQSVVVEARLATASSSNILQPQQISGPNSGSLNRVSAIIVLVILRLIFRT